MRAAAMSTWPRIQRAHDIRARPAAPASWPAARAASFSVSLLALNASIARHRCPGDGDLATGQTRRAAASFRPWQPVYQRAIPEADGRSRRRLFDEPFGQRLGQCRDGELLLVVEDRAHRTQNVPDPRRGES